MDIKWIYLICQRDKYNALHLNWKKKNSIKFASSLNRHFAKQE